MPRCCEPRPDEFESSYASVLVAGTSDELRRAVLEMERDAAICPFVTCWCSKCKRISTIVAHRDQFPRASAHLAHALTLRVRVEISLVAWENSVASENRRLINGI
jgi:hypothetical protein